MELTPDPAQKRLWIIQLVLVTSSILLLFLVPLTASRTVQSGSVFAYFAAVWLLIGGAVAFWIPLYFKSLRYEIDKDEIRLYRGVIWKQRVTIPYEKITAFDSSRGPLERLFGIGRVKLQVSGVTTGRGRRPEQALIGLKNPETICADIEATVRQHRDSGMQQENKPATESQTAMLESIQDELKEIRILLEQLLSKER
ncbi:PH domain-containing protein [bacterium]|nr:PH domain-containing protein [bacterium]